MNIEMGEYAVGAYLKFILECDVVDYKVKRPETGLNGQREIDVIGLDFKTSTVYLCEAKTHIRGLKCGDNNATIEKVGGQIDNMRDYASKYLKQFKNKKYMFWSPVVPVGILTQALSRFRTVELIINGEYNTKIFEILVFASHNTTDTGNPFFRTLQVLQHMRQD